MEVVATEVKTSQQMKIIALGAVMKETSEGF